MNSPVTLNKKAESRRRWKKNNPEKVKESKRRYRQTHRADIALRKKNTRYLRSLEIKNKEESAGLVRLNPSQIDLMAKLYPGVGMSAAVHLLLAAEANRRIGKINQSSPPPLIAR